MSERSQCGIGGRPRDPVQSRRARLVMALGHLRSLGVLVLAAFLVAACGELDLPGAAVSGGPSPAPATPAPAHGGWAQALQFSGDVQGALDQVLPDASGTRSECTGRSSRRAGQWASTLYGPVGRDMYGL